MPLLIDLVEDNDIISSGDNNKMIKRSLLYKRFITKIMNYLISNAKVVFISWKKVFIKALIFYYFYLKNNIWIEANASSYTINRISRQLTLNNLAK